jgi:peptidoglycan/LPS O-acetylase OafA/YrhL
MSRPFSIYLDLVRFVAACLVYLHHSNQRWLVESILPASYFGESAVTVFFVLSGYVIAYITDTREKTFTSYAASRISRVYSVAVPAVFLTIALDAVGRQLFPTPYGYPFDNFLLRGTGSLLLLNEVWFISITSFSNVPYWSICYEMWYYVAFGMLMFLPRRIGLIAVALLAFALGPKVVLLAPIWGLGALLYYWKRLSMLSESAAWLLVLGSCTGIALLHLFGIKALLATLLKGVIGDEWHTQLTWSRFFLSDYLLGVLVFLNFTGVIRLSERLGPLLIPLEQPIRFLANYTLSLYLLHQPLFLFWGSVIRGDPSGYSYWCITTAMVVISVFAVGLLTETKRHLLKGWLERQFVKMGALLPNKTHVAKG